MQRPRSPQDTCKWILTLSPLGSSYPYVVWDTVYHTFWKSNGDDEQDSETRPTGFKSWLLLSRDVSVGQISCSLETGQEGNNSPQLSAQLGGLNEIMQMPPKHLAQTKFLRNVSTVHQPWRCNVGRRESQMRVPSRSSHKGRLNSQGLQPGNSRAAGTEQEPAPPSCCHPRKVTFEGQRCIEVCPARKKLWRRRGIREGGEKQ